MNRIINKIKNQYKFAVYIDKNGNKNTNINIKDNNSAFITARKATRLLNNCIDKYLYNASFCIDISQSEYNTYFNNIKAGICGDSFINRNGDKVDIEFHVKHLDPNFEKQIIQKFEQDYKEQLPSSPIYNRLDIEEQLGTYIINNFYLGVIMIFVNGKYDASIAKTFKRSQTNQLKSIGYQLIHEYKQDYL